jgi:hypothetical protein
VSVWGWGLPGPLWPCVDPSISLGGFEAIIGMRSTSTYTFENCIQQTLTNFIGTALKANGIFYLHLGNQGLFAGCGFSMALFLCFSPAAAAAAVPAWHKNGKILTTPATCTEEQLKYVDTRANE